MQQSLFDVISVKCREGHLLDLRFEDGEERVFDMAPWFSRKPYQALRNPDLFNCAKVEYGTVVWPGEIDIDPETLRHSSCPLSTYLETDVSPDICVAEAPVPYHAEY